MTAEGAAGRRVARILLDTSLPQLDHLFDYAIPNELAAEIRAGQRVRVPFRSQNRKSFGTVIEFAEQSDFGGELAQIAEIVSPLPSLTPEVWRLARAVADRAAGSAGDILRLAIPTRQVRVEKQHLAGTAADPGEQDTPFEAEEADTELADLLTGGARLAIDSSHGPVRLGTGEWVGGWSLQLARAALAVHAQGSSAIVALPDYRDLDQLRDALASLGHAGVVRLDARQSKGERYAAFLRALDPEPRIIIGNRSVVYAPAHRLGAILLWDDGDPVLAEPLAPYVHARDAALVRAEQSGAGLLFAAHSRSAEVQRLVEIGYVQAQRHPPRRTRVVHADASMTPDVFAGRVPEFAARIIRQESRRGPVLVQVATPGYAPIAVCASCGDVARCRACAGPIGFRSAGVAACRWCGEPARPWQCRTCDGTVLAERGMGSQRTVEQFERQFSDARVLLSDGEHPRERVDARPALVVATRGAEPIAAGGYRAVVLLDAERLLGIESLRAAEDCLRWWENAAALAAPDGQCVMASGGGPTVQAFVTGRTEEWRAAELRDRHALRYPPAIRVASVTGGTAEVERALASIRDLGAQDPTVPGIDVLGPVPARGPSGHEQVPGIVRLIVRFEYSLGLEIARRLRGVLVADAAGSSARTRGRPPGRARPEALRLRFDDRGVFDG